jgi:hypothetical protein
MRNAHRSSLYAVAVSAGLILAGCSGEASPSSDESTEEPIGVGADPLAFKLPIARLRIVHASPDAPKVDIYVRGIPFPIVRAAYGQSTRYLPFFRGNYTIDLRASPSRVTDPVAYSTGPVSLASGAKITAVAAGLLASKDAASAFRVLPLAESFQDGKANEAVVRIVHASPDAPTVGIDVGNDDPTNSEVPSLARFADTGASGIALPANAALQVGITAGGNRVTAFTTPALPAGADLFVIATGLLGKLPREVDGFDLLAVGPRGTIGFIRQNPVVYALHASPNAPAVDVFAGTTKVLAGLSFGGLSEPLQLPPGGYTLDFFGASASAAPEGAPAASATVQGLAAGERYLTVATGFLGATSNERAFNVLVQREGFALDDAAGARVRALHASPDAPAVDLGPASGGTLSSAVVKGLAFGSSTDATGLALPAANLTLGVAAAGTSKAVASFDIATAAGQRAFVVAAGALDPSRGEGFRLIAIDTKASPWTAASVLAKP